MRIEKKTLNDAMRVLGKVVCQISPVELYRSVRFVGDANGIQAMATDGVETVSMAMDAFTDAEIDFCVPPTITQSSNICPMTLWAPPSITRARTKTSKPLPIIGRK